MYLRTPSSRRTLRTTPLNFQSGGICTIQVQASPVMKFLMYWKHVFLWHNTFNLLFQKKNSDPPLREGGSYGGGFLKYISPVYKVTETNIRAPWKCFLLFYLTHAVSWWEENTILEMRYMMVRICRVIEHWMLNESESIERDWDNVISKWTFSIFQCCIYCMDGMQWWRKLDKWI